MSKPYDPEGMERWGGWFDREQLAAAREAAFRQGIPFNEWMRQIIDLALQALRS